MAHPLSQYPLPPAPPSFRYPFEVYEDDDEDGPEPCAVCGFREGVHADPSGFGWLICGTCW